MTSHETWGRKREEENIKQQTGEERMVKVKRLQRTAPVHPVTGGLWFLLQGFLCSLQALLSEKICKNEFTPSVMYKCNGSSLLFKCDY